MEHIQYFEQAIVDAAKHSADLTIFHSQEVAVFSQYIRDRGWQKNVKILDADGKSSLLAVGLSLEGYDVYTINPVGITIPDSLESSMGQTIKSFQSHQKEKFNVVLLPHDAISDNLTSDALQQTLVRLFDVMEKNSIIVIKTRFYDHLLRSQSKNDSPYQLTIAGKRLIKFSVWEWLSKPECTYRQDHFIIQQIEDSCMIQSAKSHHRAWRRAELNMSLSQVGFQGIQYHSLKGQTLVIATKV